MVKRFIGLSLYLVQAAGLKLEVRLFPVLLVLWLGNLQITFICKGVYYVGLCAIACPNTDIKVCIDCDYFQFLEETFENSKETCYNDTKGNIDKVSPNQRYLTI